MPANFLDLPSEIRNDIYEKLLVLQEPIIGLMNHWYFGLGFGGLTPGLLLVNRRIHEEASSLLYAQNCFDFSTYCSNDISEFLKTIGHKNAQYIRNVRLDFPILENLHQQSVSIESDSAKTLEEIRNACSNLNSITISLISTQDEESKLAANPSIIPEAIALVDIHLRTIPSLQNIIVEVYKDGPNACARTEMKCHGWILSEQEGPEVGSYDLEFFGSYDSEFDDYTDYYDPYEDDWRSGYYTDDFW